ncbi:hypothetical protein PsorP6_013434 [Peronosclerospora sorghi]|uniref:Uncharacterized protein n=1 Tax=Peronosclerospora sorghi TaxID=230839 RepID=A0ACC0VIS0_9STRA|nr:hypothetical protein PsorP6_013434 [Peronosclerospora sorghi]
MRTDGYWQDVAPSVNFTRRYTDCVACWCLEVHRFDPHLGCDINFFSLCPRTPMLFLDHLWGGIPKSPRWPEDKLVYMMPVIETKITPVLWSDVVLSKTQECYQRVTK